MINEQKYKDIIEKNLTQHIRQGSGFFAHQEL